MKVEYVSKKGKHKMKVMEAKLKLVKKSVDGKEESEEYTVAELIDRYISVNRSIAVLSDFTTRMAVALYRCKPDHPFISQHGKEFEEFVRKAEDQMSMKETIAGIELALRKAEEEKDGTLPVQDKTIPASA